MRQTTTPYPRSSFSWALWLLALLVLLSLPFHAYSQATQQRNGPIDKRLTDLEKNVARLSGEIDVYSTDNLPEPLTLCGRKVYLSRDDARERFEREYFQLLENRGLLTVLVKRYLKYYALINGEIQKAGQPSDLIYLVIMESYLNPRALSRANAAGLWQFIKETGKMEGLAVTEHLDERYNIKKATRSALAHLKRLHGEFNDWLIAMAAYNAGAGRLREAIRNQETTDFFQLYLPEETERYIFRVLAIKEIITQREKLGIYVDERTFYKPVVISEVTVNLDQDIHAVLLAKCMDLSYRAFRMLNLQFRRYRIPRGTYTVNVPSEKRDQFVRRLKDYPSVTVVE